MRSRWFAYGVLIACTLASCSDSHEDAAGAGGGAADRDGGHSGTGGQHDASMEPLSCSQRETMAADAIADALVGADLGCATRDDCEEVSIDTACHAACGAVIAKAHKAALERAIASQDETTCDGFEADGCTRIVPPCDPPLGVSCVAGRCTDGPPVDAGTPACIDHTIRWGADGGLVASRLERVLEPCARYRVFQMTGGQPDEMICDNVVPDDRTVSVDDLDALIASDDVQAAIAAAPVVFGIDSRPVDGTLLRIDIDGAILDVGAPCGSGPGCTEIPAGVSALATMLQDLVGQQHDVTPTCMNTT